MAKTGDLLDDMLAVQASIAAAFGSIMDKDSSASVVTGDAADPEADAEPEQAIKNAKAKSAPSPNTFGGGGGGGGDADEGNTYDLESGGGEGEGGGGATSSAWPAEGDEAGNSSMMPYGEEVDADDPLSAALAKLNGVQDWSVKDSALPLESIPADLSFQHAYHMALKETYPDGHSVKVTGLQGEDDMSAEDLQKHFILCGEVRRVILKIDRATGQRTGTAYVDFATAEAAEMAVALTGSDISGHTVEVEIHRGAGHVWVPPKGVPKGVKGGGKWGGCGCGGGGTTYAKGYGAAKGQSFGDYGDYGGYDDWSSDWGGKGGKCGKGKAKGKACGKWGWYPPSGKGKGWYPY
mmetsp:Transcript_54261/g.115798  ORF Transcript_54261/g.115798 Transcript_54261/m.115798 type:complete len:350 (+) Transcript_54261:89-1138(+)